MWRKQKHTDDSPEDDWTNVSERQLPQSVVDVEDTYHRVVEARTRLLQIIEEVDAAGRAPGMPADSMQKQLAAAQGIVDALSRIDDNYRRYRQELDLLSDPDTEEFEDAVADLEEFGETIAETPDNLAAMAQSLSGLRDRLIQVASDLAPIRERIRSGYAAATEELARRGAYAPGRHSLEARINVAGDRMRTLEEGRFTPTPERGLTTAYRELEVEIGTIRDDIAKLTP